MGYRIPRTEVKMIEKNEKQELAREYLGKATPAAQKAFEEGARIASPRLLGGSESCESRI